MPASPSTARAINDRLALRLLQREGPLTAGQLKQLTGLSRPTVADLVERLTASGLIEMVGESGAQRRGPNARLYGIVGDRAHLAALDVRLESVSVLVSDLVGRVLAEASVPIDADAGTGPAVEQAVALVERAVKEAGARATGPGATGVQRREPVREPEPVREWGSLHTVGIGAPGLIDPATGELRDTTGLPAWHRSLVAALQERLPDARVVVENETNLAALAEMRDGAARDRDTFVLLWLDMGIGAAVVLDGALRRGASGGAGELGFLPVPGTRGLPSATDCEGGFHSLAGAAAVLELARECGVLGVGAAGERATAPEVVRWAVATVADGDAEAVRPDAPRGAPAPRKTDARAARLLDTLADRLALGVASVVALLDPGCVVLGGEVGQAGGDELAVRVAERIAGMSPLPVEVRPSLLGDTAVLRGALLTAQDGAQDELFG
ncbi:ROK family transcriptional regulator [Streptomyces sp. NBC_01622]|uniref:ROK family transcriptional regulator n=1 Tax=Streptomyces sp. NBC_01622 TaxID=2975903 RepID=UPI00386AE7A6|nr:ROK family transcriptional regulator [Streptomyces sp. NBC_01622]